MTGYHWQDMVLINFMSVLVSDDEYNEEEFVILNKNSAQVIFIICVRSDHYSSHCNSVRIRMYNMYVCSFVCQILPQSKLHLSSPAIVQTIKFYLSTVCSRKNVFSPESFNIIPPPLAGNLLSFVLRNWLANSKLSRLYKNTIFTNTLFLSDDDYCV